MSDRLRRTFSLSIKYAEGEMPSAAKLNGVSTQARSAFAILETAIGDVWNQAGDLMLSPDASPTTNATHITNIARAIGDMGLLNSMLPGALDSDMVYVDKIGDRYSGMNRAFLKYPVAASPSVSNVILSGTFAPLVQIQFQSSPVAVLVTGDWCVTQDGNIYTFDTIPSTLSITYTPSIVSDVSDLDAISPSWNVIPDPTTWSGNYAGIKISFANNTDSSSGYHIWLPPRKPLDSTKTIINSPVSTSNIAANPEAVAISFFQDTAANASLANADHYRYNLPNEITSVGGANDVLPAGFLYIWDETTGTIIEGMTSYVPGNAADRKFKFRAIGTNLVTTFGSSIGNGIVTDDTTQLPADYKIRFKVIVASTSLAKTTSYLNRAFWKHSHKINEGGVPISHDELDDLVTPGYNASFNSAYPSGVHSFTKTSWSNDSHPQYLHRAGSTLSGGSRRDPDDNALYNRLIIKSPYTATGTGLRLSADDSGTNVRISASINTALILDGTGTAAVNLFNCQVNRYLYFRAGTIPDSSLAVNNYIDFQNGTYVFIANNSAAGISAGTIIGNQVAANTTYTGGDTAPGSRLGQYNYSFPRYQYLHISPMDFCDISGLARVTYQYIYNNDTGNSFEIWAHVRLPHGAILESTGSVRAWVAGNGTTGLGIIIGETPKPTSSSFSFSGGTNRLVATSAVTNTNSVFDTTYGITTTIDNSITGNYYVITLNFPVKISTAQPKFWGITLQYRMPQVDN